MLELIKTLPSTPEEEIFHVVRGLPQAERSAYLSNICRGDRALRERIERLLASDGNTVFMPPPVIPPDPTLKSGDRVGEYKLLQEIGEGTFGTVWMAEQESPVGRRVALKIIKLGLDSKEVVARFEQERQMLAVMEHPNVAKILGGGVTEYGRPYFVMELIKGKALSAYCDDEALGVRERLELFVHVCRAVHHAHQKGIIHRDLKPSNILVTKVDGQAVPRVIDFGVAKAMQGPLTKKTLFTRFEQLVGTLMYMSPEQAELTSQDIDTRSDIYSLGIVLYQLLTGCTPIDAATVNQEPLDQVLHLIRKVDPPTPSARVKTLAPEALTAAARCRATEPGSLSGRIRGDLDWIVMMCIEKDRKRRYESANALALDIERHLENKPVEARPPTYGYVIGRFIQRNQLAVSAAAAVATALIIGAGVSIHQASRAIAALKVARAAEADTEAVNNFLVKRILTPPRPQGVEGGLGIDITVAQALEQAEKELERDFADRPRAEVIAREAIGVTWETLGRYQEAARQLERTIELRKRGASPDDPALLKTFNNLAVVYQKAGDLEKALPLFEMVWTKRKEALPPDHPDCIVSMNNLAGAYLDAGRVPEAIPLYEQALEISKATFGPDDPNTLKILSGLARAWRIAGSSDSALALKALPLYESALEKSESILRPNHPDTLTCMNNLAVCLEQAGKTEAALALYERVMGLSKTKLGDDHPDTLISMYNLAGVCRKTGDRARAIELYEEALKKGRIKPGADHPDTVNATFDLAVTLEESGKLQEAILGYEDVVKRRKSRLGPDHSDTLRGMSYLASAYLENRQSEDALLLFKEIYERRNATLGPENQDTLKSLYALARCYQVMGKLKESRDLFQKMLAATEKRRPLPKGYPQVSDTKARMEEILPLLKPKHP